MKIGLIGTGLMGGPIAQRLHQVKMPVMVYNRTIAKLKPLAEMGIAIASDITELLSECDPIILVLTDAQAIQTVLLLDHLKSQLAGKTIIQMGTIGPSDSRQLNQAITNLNGEYLEAPVLGSIPEAKEGKLLVMVGATDNQFQQWENLLAHLGPNPRHIGPVGTAAALKLALNQLIATLTTGFALSLNFVQKQGVPVTDFMEILRASALYAPTFDKKLSRMLENNYDHPNFPTKHLSKDVNLFLQEAAANGLRIDSLDGISKILEVANELGLNDADYSALCKAIVISE